MERGWVMRGLLPWNLICPKATAAPPSVQAMWVSRRSLLEIVQGGQCGKESLALDRLDHEAIVFPIDQGLVCI
jgi:hypothetical protein